MLSIKLSVPRAAETDAAGNVTKQAVKGGTVCVYGLTSKFPVALYPNQWRELAKYVPSILAFIDTEEKAGRITEREATAPASGDRVALRAIDPVVAAIMAAKGVDATEATRIAKASGFLK